MNIEHTYLERSILYSLEPKNVQTPYVESLTSYVVKLANKHSVYVSTLITEYIAPLLGKEFLLNSVKKGGNRFYDGARTLNGISHSAVSFLEIIERLTLVPDLKHLTLTEVKKIIPDRGLLNKTLSWCPRCLKEQLEENKHDSLTLPLIWSLNPVKVCSIHKINLECKCSTCHNLIPILHRRSVNGFCPYCRSFLGYNKINKGISLKNLWIAIAIEEYIKVIQTLTISSFSQEQLTRNLNKIIEVYTEGNVEAFSKFVSIPKTTIWEWRKGKVLPPLGQIANLCYQLNIPITSIYFDKDLCVSNRVQFSNNESRRKVQRKQSFQYDKAKEYLENYLNNIPEEYISMSKLAIKIGFNKRVLYQHFPELCREVASKYKRSIEERKAQRQQSLIKKIDDIVLEASQEGKYPGKKDIERILGIQGVFREQKIKEHYQYLKERFLEG